MRLDSTGTKAFIIKCYDQISRLLISFIPELAEHNRHEKRRLPLTTVEWLDRAGFDPIELGLALTIRGSVLKAQRNLTP